ncbi:MAG: hypothetical protein MUE42_07610 [Opitutaceae bacterium]|jgi:hypothetical protein|nr:hypothetical protein [Opitutaceae bacterium]
MAHDPYAAQDQKTLELIEHSPTGAVPHTPTYQDSLARLRASFQIYASADHKAGYVTARSLAGRPAFHARNLDEFFSGSCPGAALESDADIFDRYLASLSPELRAPAAEHRAHVITRRVHHRPKHGIVAQDPIHTLLLIPGGGAHPGLPGNYLHGALIETPRADGTSLFYIQLHDREDGIATGPEQALDAAWAGLRDVLASAPFHLRELEALGFTVA